MRKELVVVGAVTGAALVAATVAALMVVRDRKQRNEQRRKRSLRSLRKFARDCATPVPKLWSIADDLASCLVYDTCHSSSSSSSSEPDSPLRLVVSYVHPLPTGEEKGWYYGVNLRGKTLIILSAQLRGKREPISHLNRDLVSVPSAIMAATSQELFNFIASTLSTFINRHGGYEKDSDQHDEKRILGFTFTYPPDQPEASLSKNPAFKWKSFAFDDKEAKEVVEEMNRALERHGLSMRVFSLVDDTVGDLASGRYYSDDAIAAINLGTGTNAAYVEQGKAVSSSHKSDELVVNVDWGDFKSSHLPLTEYDECLDIESSNPGCRTFDKLISGMYLGEIVRKVLLKMAQESALFGAKVPPKLSCPNLLRPMDVAAMHQDTSEEREVIEDKLRDVFGITEPTPMARELVGEICDIVAERGARLAGAGIVGIMKKLDRIKDKKSVVLVQGGLYEHYRVFRNYVHSSVWEMLGNEHSDNVIIQPCHGGSGAGSLFVAATHESRMHHE